MTISKKRLYILVIGIVVGLAIIAGTTTAIVVTRPDSNAYNIAIGNEPNLEGYVGNLLTNDGRGINGTTYVNLINKIGAIGSVNGEQKASEINGGSPVIFQMGELEGKPIYWQVVYRTNDYITIWMTQPYQRGQFNPSSTTSGYEYNGNYSNSYLRRDTLEIYDEQVSNFPIIDRIVAQPSVAASSWQETQDNSYYSSSTVTSITNGLGTQTSTTNPNSWEWESCMSDKFWIPSFFEVYNDTMSSVSNSEGTYTGLWGLNSLMRGFSGTALNGNSTSNYCWLRSGSL